MYPNDSLRHDTMEKLYKEIEYSNDFSIHEKKYIRIRKISEDKAKEARKNSNLNSGTYLSVEAAFEKSKQDSVVDMKRKPFSHRGKVGIQLAKGGMPVAKAISCTDPNLKIDTNPDPNLFFKTNKNGKRLGLRKFGKDERIPAIVRIKLSGSVKDAVFIDLKCILHRPLPPNGIIKWAYVYTYRKGLEQKYELQLTLESESFIIPIIDKNESVLAIKFGWRSKNNKIKLASTWDGQNYKEIYCEDGKKQTNRRNPLLSVIERDNQKEKLLGYSSLYFDNAKENLIKFLSENILNKKLEEVINNGLSLHLREDYNTLPKMINLIKMWNSHEKLYKIVNVLKNEYLKNNELQLWNDWVIERKNSSKNLYCNSSDKSIISNIFDELIIWFQNKGINNKFALHALCLEWWLKKDIHLVNMARNIEAKNKNYLKDFYRKIAFNLSNEYKFIITNDYDLNKIAETPESENDNRSQQEQNANSNRQMIGISNFQGAIKEKFGNRFIKESSIKNTSNHFGCGGELTKDELKMEQITCRECHKIINIDENNVKHLYAIFFNDAAREAQ